MNSGIYVRLDDDSILLGDKKCGHIEILEGVSKARVVSAGYFLIFNKVVSVIGDSVVLNVSRLPDDVAFVRNAISNNQTIKLT